MQANKLRLSYADLAKDLRAAHTEGQTDMLSVVSPSFIYRNTAAEVQKSVLHIITLQCLHLHFIFLYGHL